MFGTPEADRILFNKGVFLIPDILCNAGGVIVSYFEWVQDRQGYFWKESVVNDQLETIMKSSFEDVVRYAETHHVNNRIAAYINVQSAAGKVRTVDSESGAARVGRFAAELLLIFARAKRRDDF